MQECRSAGSGLTGITASSSSGVPEGVIKDTLILELGDVDGLRECFNREGNNIAAVIIEPLPANNGLLIPRINFLKDIKPDVIINLSANVGSLNYVARNAADVFDSNLNMLLNLYKGVKELIPKTVIINPVANCSYPGNLDFYSEDKYWDGAVHDSVLSFGSTRRMMIVTSECYKIQYGIRSVNYLVPNLYGPFDSTDPDKAHALNALISINGAKSTDERC